MQKAILILLVFSFILVGCRVNDKANAITNQEDIIITDVWIRPGSANRNTGLFLTINNNSSITDTLYKAESDLAQVVEIHETYKKENDMMGMRHIDFLVIPKKSTVELKPGSFHIMLIGLNKDLNEGETGNVKLFFKVKGEISILNVIVHSGN